MKKIIVALALLVSGLFFIPASPAAADTYLDGCSGAYVKKVDTWSNIKKVHFSNYTDPGGVDVRMDFVASSVYWYCPNGKGANKVKPTHYSFCTIFLGGANTIPGDGDAYYGTKWDAAATGGGYNVESPQIQKWNNWKRQQCKNLSIPTGNRKWLLLKYNPSWHVMVIVNKELQKDYKFFMRDTSSWWTPHWKNYEPIHDNNVTRWYKP